MRECFYRFFGLFCIGLVLAAVSPFAMQAQIGSAPHQQQSTTPPLEARWVDNTSGPFYTGTADVEPGGSFYIEPYYFDYRTRGSHTVNAPFKLAYGLGHNFEFDLYAPLVFVRNANPDQDGSTTNHASSSGYGDTIAQVKWQFLKEKDRFHLWSKPSMGLLFAVNIPTGRYQGLQQNLFGSDQQGTGEWNEQFGVMLRKQFKPFELYMQETDLIEDPVNVVGPYSFDNGLGQVPPGQRFQVVDGDQFSSSAALEHVVVPKYGLGYLVEYLGEWQTSHSLIFGHATTPTYSYFNLMPELEVTWPHKGRFSMTWGGGASFTVARRNYPAQFTPMFTVSILADLHGSR